MEGSKKKKAIDQSLEELRKKFNKNIDESPKYDDVTHAKSSSKNISTGVFKPSQVIIANAHSLMKMVNNLYVGNLVNEVTEDILLRIYSKYGEIESIKLMQARSEEERKRKRNCAFIKFYKYEAAYLAKEELGEKFLYGQQMRICWAKGTSNQIAQAGWMADYKGVKGDQEVEMNFIEEQLNHYIMGLDLPNEDQILNKEYSFFEPHLPRI